MGGIPSNLCITTLPHARATAEEVELFGRVSLTRNCRKLCLPVLNCIGARAGGESARVWGEQEKSDTLLCPTCRKITTGIRESAPRKEGVKVTP